MTSSNEIQLKPDERVDELNRKGYRIIQDTKQFCFGMDAVLLSAFVKVKPKQRVLDLGTGTGVIPILLEAKTPGEHFTGLEIQPDSADMAGRSVALNGLTDKIDIVTGNIVQSYGYYERECENTKAGGTFFYGTPSVSSDGNHLLYA